MDENLISYIPTPNVYMTKMKICSLMAPLLTQPIWVITRIILNCRKQKISIKLVRTLGKLSTYLNTMLLLLLLLFWKAKIQSLLITRWSRKLIIWEPRGRAKFQDRSFYQAVNCNPNCKTHKRSYYPEYRKKKRTLNKKKNSVTKKEKTYSLKNE